MIGRPPSVEEMVDYKATSFVALSEHSLVIDVAFYE